MPILNISEQVFKQKNISVTLEWIPKNGASYSVMVDPELKMNHLGRSSAQFTLLYDIMYNVSVVASLCGRNSSAFVVVGHGKLDIVFTWVHA